MSKRKKQHLLKNYGHRCQLEIKDDLQEIIPGTKCWDYIKKGYHSIFMISDTNHTTKLCCQSLYKLKVEIHDHVFHHRFKIHPTSRFRVFWEILMIIVNLINMTYLLWNYIFCTIPNKYLRIECVYVVEVIFQALCFLDIFLNFITGYYDNERNICMSFKAIAIHYIRYRFILDLLSALSLYPFVVTLLAKMDMHFLGLIVTIRIFRMANLMAYIYNTTRAYKVNKVKIKIISLILASLLLIHWYACLSIVIDYTIDGLLSDKYPNRKSWFTHHGLWNSSRHLIYTTSLYRSTCILSGSEHDNIYLLKSGYIKHDTYIKIIMWILSRVLFAIFISVMIQIFRIAYSGKLKYRKKMHKLGQFSDQKQLSPEITNRLKQYYEFKYQNTITKEKYILKNVSMKMRQDIVIGNRMKIIEKVTFLRNLPQNILLRMCAGFTEQIFLPGDIIIKSGSKSEHFNIILSGTIAVYTKSGIEIRHISDGAYFGEVELFIPNSLAICTMVALEPCEIFCLNRKEFLDIVATISTFPEVMKPLQYHIDEHIRNSNIIQLQYKQWLQEHRESRRNQSGLDDSDEDDKSTDDEKDSFSTNIQTN